MKHKMPTISVISKTNTIQVTPVKSDSVPAITGNRIAYQLRHIINFEAVFGINRLYLLNNSRIIRIFDHVLSIFLMSTTVYHAVQNFSSSASYTVIVDTTCVEYLCLVLICMLTRKSCFRNMLKDMASFDDLMNLTDDLHITSPSGRGSTWIVLSVLYSIIEFLALSIRTDEFDYSFLLTYITLVAHDCEQVFFCSLLRMILMRVYIIKAHVEKTFSISARDSKRKLSKVEMLSKKAQLDISSLHRNYELLHKCSEQLNSIMSLPMMIMLFCSGLSTTMLLRMIFRNLQGINNTEYSGTDMIAYATSRCLRYTILVIIPCYFSSVTTNQVTHIRTMLHDAMNQVNTGKFDRRRIKAFFQLTRENEFAYALWGVIRLNMSLPLSYLSLCTTYLVIIIQFSKFID